ncbi:MAG: hypothetical protein V3V00_11865 [Saprospiraceae bacterium]
MSKPKVITEYKKVETTIVYHIKLNYPHGFEKHLVLFKNKKNKYVSALPFETEDRYYLIKMTAAQAKEIVQNDKDYDDDGHLKAKAIEKLRKKLKAKESPKEPASKNEKD